MARAIQTACNATRSRWLPEFGRLLVPTYSYDALSTWRCYKAATSPERARDVIQNAAGKHFNPRLIEIFLQLSDQFSYVRQPLGDLMNSSS
jgi:putative two-component system response regulator